MQDYLNSTFRTVAWFKKHSQEETLEINPLFQRNPVWTSAQQSYLVDSILNGYPIPELYMQEVVDESGRETQVVVDGQQRIRACLDFIDGVFAINTKKIAESNWQGMSFEDLSPEQKKHFFSYRFVVRLLPQMSSESLREIFKRLNRVVESLREQELRHATYWGPFIQTAESLADTDFWSFFGLFTPQAIKRMDDVEFVSELIIAILHGPQNKKSKLNDWYQAYEQEFDEQRLVQDVFNCVLGEIRQVLPDLKNMRWRKKSDFYTLFSVLATSYNHYPLASEVRSKLSDALKDFAKQVSICSEILGNDARREELDSLSKYVIPYTRAVERAATDIANRRIRNRNLFAFLNESLPLVFDYRHIMMPLNGNEFIRIEDLDNSSPPVAIETSDDSDGMLNFDIDEQTD